MLDCNQWKTDYRNCYEWEKNKSEKAYVCADLLYNLNDNFLIYQNNILYRSNCTNVIFALNETKLLAINNIILL